LFFFIKVSSQKVFFCLLDFLPLSVYKTAMNSERKYQSNDSEHWRFNINKGFGASFIKRGIVKNMVRRHGGVILFCLGFLIGNFDALAISLGDRIQANSTVNVRQTAAGTVLGTQSSGSLGVTIGGPTIATLNGTQYTWWNINFDTGVDGWVATVGFNAVTPATPTSPSPGTTSSPGPVQASSTVTLSWGASSGATYYDVGVVDVATGTMVASGYPTTTSFTATLTAGKTYRWNVAAGDSAGESSFTTVLYFQTPGTKPPTPTSPSPGTTSSPGPVQSSSTVTLSWGASSGATYYDYGVVDVATGTMVASGYPTTTSVTVTLTAGKTYRWNVAADNAAGESTFTTVLYFQTPTSLLPAPTLNGPADGATGVSTTPTFSWSTVSGANRYWLICSTSLSDLPTDPNATTCPNCVTYGLSGLTDQTSYTPPATFPYGGTTRTLNAGTLYYWKVQGWNTGGTQGNYSSVRTFTTAAALLPAPTLNGPADGATGVSTTPTFSWSTVSGANRYWLICSTSLSDLPTDPNATTCPNCVTYGLSGLTDQTSYTPPATFPYGGTTRTLNAGTLYYWKVQGWNTGGTQGNYSSVRSFTVTNSTVTTTNLAVGIDVYAGNGTINWSAVSNAGIQFAYLKATESTYSPDSKFSANTNGAIGQHIIAGAYHFATPLFSPSYYQPSYDHTDTAFQEASNFVNAAKGVIGSGFLPPSLDVEAQVVTWTLVGGVYVPSVWVDPLTGASYDNSGNPLPSQPAMGASALGQWINDWVSKVEQLTHTNVIPVIYCDRYYATNLYPYLNAATLKLWIADYSHPAGSPTPPAGWQWEFHQYSSTGSVGGISPVDLDVFNSNLAALIAYVNGGSSGGGGGGSSPVISSPKLTGSTFTLSVPTQIGTNYVLEYKNLMSDANWIPIQTNSGNGAQMTLTNAGATGSSRFYRIRLQ
jgi:GH25 family lysozyme M1 (1,4-beta-N-acetylmuramidase)